MDSGKTIWRMVRVPDDLARRLHSLADRVMESHVRGRLALPGRYVEKVPLYFVVELALNEFESKRRRSCQRPRRLGSHQGGPASR